MKKFLLNCLLFCSLHSFSQNQFFDYYPDYYLSVTYTQKIIPTHDNGRVVLFDNNQWIFLYKFDSLGINTWSRHYEFPGYELFTGDISEHINHDLTISGLEFLDPSGIEESFFLMRVDSVGNLLKVVIDSDSTHEYAAGTGIVSIGGLESDGGMVISGSVKPDSSQFHSGFISKIDTAGTAQWIYYLYPDTNTDVIDVQSSVTDSGNIIVTGYFYYYNWIQSPNYFFIMKFDSTGVLQWSKHSAQNSGGLFFSWSTEAIEKGGSYYVTSGRSLDAPQIYKVFDNGQLDWHSSYHLQAGGNRMMKTHDGRIILTCEDTTVNFPSINVEIDSTGAMVRNMDYYVPYPRSLYFWQNIETPAGELIACGVETSTGLWSHVFASLDSLYRTTCVYSSFLIPPNNYYNDGLISSGSVSAAAISFTGITPGFLSTFFTLVKGDYCNFSHENENEPEEILFRINPNPASLTFTVSTTHKENERIEIYDLFGAEKFSAIGICERGPIQISVAGWSPGIYFVKLQNEKGSSVQKLIVQ